MTVQVRYSAIKFILLYSGLRLRVVYMVTILHGGITMLQKAKVVLLQAMKAYKGAPNLLNPCTRRRWVVSITPRPLYTLEWNEVNYWTGGWVGPRAGLDVLEKKKILLLPIFEPRAGQSSAQSLCRLYYPHNTEDHNISINRCDNHKPHETT
jgi:hypothetical protein